MIPTNAILDTPRPVDTGEPDKGRLTVQVTIHHQHCCNDPTTAATNFTRILESEEQPWVRHIRVGPQWQPIDLGWLAGDVPRSLLAVKNMAGLGLTANPTEEQKKAVDASVLQIRQKGQDDADGFEVLPRGDMFVGKPRSWQLEIRALCPDPVPAVVWVKPG